jgi:hypothetical protein
MVYEAHWNKRFHLLLGGMMVALSLIGFFVAGIIPSASTRDHGAYPLAGAAMILFCFAIAAFFLRRALSDGPQARIDANGVYARAHNERTIPWSEITSARRLGRGKKSYVSFKLRDPAAFPSRNRVQRVFAGLDRKLGLGDFSINPNFYDHGMRDLAAALRHYRPDLAL